MWRDSYNGQPDSSRRQQTRLSSIYVQVWIKWRRGGRGAELSGQDDRFRPLAIVIRLKQYNTLDWSWQGLMITADTVTLFGECR